MTIPITPPFTVMELQKLSRAARHGFTLIELLVVITIIVVLLALLTPALDKAVYQAQLAVCGSKLHAITTGAITYAMGSKRQYPDRPARRSNGSNRPIDLYYGLNQLHHLDDRLILKQFIDINENLNCPLVQEIDIEGSSVNGAVLSPYGLYFGWGYGKKGEKEMRKLGDRWTYGDVSFNVLCSDWDSIYTHSSATYATHPDQEGVMAPYRVQDEGGAGFVGTATFSYWAAATERPPIDTNYAFDDGSVIRFTAVAWNEGPPQSATASPDPTGVIVPNTPGLETVGNNRLVWAPQSDVQNQPTWFFRVPGTR